MSPERSNEPEDLWKRQQTNDELMQFKMKPEELAAMVRSREKQNRVVRMAVLTVTALLALGFLYNVWSADRPWIRFSQAWVFGLLTYLVGTGLGGQPQRKAVSENGARFLERQHEERARAYLQLRNRLWLTIPAIAAAWLGGGTLLLARAQGVHPTSEFHQFCAGPWPYFVTLGLLVLVWFLFGAAAAKARRDIEQLRRSIAL